jgi:hypothetical protein
MAQPIQISNKNIDPEAIRYIKLGGKGAYESKCINERLCYMGFGSDDPQCAALIATATKSRSETDWEKVWEYRFANDQKGTEQARRLRATQARNQLRAFYEAGDETLWITFYKNKLYYAFLDPQLPAFCSGEHGGSFRHVSGDGWRCLDREGNELREDIFSGQLLQIKGFQGTSCEVRGKSREHLFNKINCRRDSYHKDIHEGIKQVRSGLVEAIKSLWPGDFEILVELIFSRFLVRYGKTGGNQDFSDILFFNPLHRMKNKYEKKSPLTSVQVKTKASPEDFHRYIYNDKITDFGSFYFVYHTSDAQKEDFKVPEDVDIDIHVLSGEEIAAMAIDAGLIDWIKDKSL